MGFDFFAKPEQAASFSISIRDVDAQCELIELGNPTGEREISREDAQETIDSTSNPEVKKVLQEMLVAHPETEYFYVSFCY